MDAELKNAPTLKDIREQNTGNILRSFLRSRELVRNALAAENQISTMTVKHIVDDLLAAGAVVERAGEVGKMILDVAPDGKFITVEDRIALPSLLRAWGRPEAGFAALLEAYRTGEASAKAVLDPALELTARLLYNLLWVYNPTRLVVDSCERDYSALIAGRMEQLLAAAHSEAIPIRVELRQARYDEYHQMRGCFHMARERWIEELASPRGRVSV